MTTRLALLGSINIGGNRIKMADLREKLSARGFGAVETETRFSESRFSFAAVSMPVATTETRTLPSKS